MIYVVTGTCLNYLRPISEQIVRKLNDFRIDNFKVQFRDDGYTTEVFMERNGQFDLTHEDSEIFNLCYREQTRIEDLWKLIPQCVFELKPERTFSNSEDVFKVDCNKIKTFLNKGKVKNICVSGIFSEYFLNYFRSYFGYENVKVLNIIRNPSSDFVFQNLNYRDYLSIVESVNLGFETFKFENLKIKLNGITIDYKELLKMYDDNILEVENNLRMNYNFEDVDTFNSLALQDGIFEKLKYKPLTF